MRTEENQAHVPPRFYEQGEAKLLRSEPGVDQPLLSLAPAQQTHPNVVPLTQLLTSEVANGGGEWPQPPRDDVEPLVADLRRLHVTVSRRLLKKLEAAQSGLGHGIPGATGEQVVEAALDLLLELLGCAA